MKIKRLSWAGILVQQGDFSLFIDPLWNVAPLKDYMGEPLTELVPIMRPQGQVSALVTHIHPDHYDIEILRSLLASGGCVHAPAEVVSKAAQESDVLSSAVSVGKTFSIGPFDVTPVPAMDWRGAEQVSWVVRSDNAALFHGGDTLWHGYWWNIAREHGPFDAAFLPINGVVAIFPGMEPSGLPATLTPHHAAVATRVLGAKQLCPIHYGTFNNPPKYAEFPNPVAAVKSAADKEGIRLRLLQPDESIDFSHQSQ